MKSFFKNIFFKDISRFKANFITLVLVIIYSSYLFSKKFLIGDAWAFEDYDSSLHVAGWWMYVQDEWRFPLLKSLRFNDFGGLNLAFADGIPIAGLFFKSIKGILPAHFHYFGYWYLFVYALQAFASTYFLRVLGAKTAFSVFVGFIFVLTWPALVLRFGHAALSAQCLLIFAMAIYFAGRTDQIKIDTATKILGLFSIIGLLIHPYLYPPLVAIFLVLLLDFYLQEKKLIQIIKYLIIYGVILAFLIYILGYLDHDTNNGGGGYAIIFRLDLLSPFCGNGKLFKCDFVKEGIDEWERVNYFGLGLIILLPYAIYLGIGKYKTFIVKYKYFLLFLLSLSLYAITNVVDFNGAPLIRFDTPLFLDSILRPFRVGPRFFWMVGYFVLFITLATYLKQKNWIVISILSIGLIVQLFDLQPINKQLRSVIQKKSEKNYPQYTNLMQHVDKLVGYPALDCERFTLPFYTHLELVAGYYSKALNSGSQARFNPNCDKHHQKILHGEVQSRHLYTTDGGGYGNYPFDTNIQKLPKVYQELYDSGSCAIKSDTMFFLCLKDTNPNFWLDLGPSYYPVINSRKSRNYYILEMHKQVGENINRLRVGSKTDKYGLLAGAPYYQFAKGKYEMTIHYSSDNSNNETVGKWTSDLWETNNYVLKKPFNKGVFKGSLGKPESLSSQFEIMSDDEKYHFAINVFNEKGTQLTIHHFTVTKLD